MGFILLHAGIEKTYSATCSFCTFEITKPVYVKASSIIKIRPIKDGDAIRSAITQAFGVTEQVAESPDEIIKMINESEE